MAENTFIGRRRYILQKQNAVKVLTDTGFDDGTWLFAGYARHATRTGFDITLLLADEMLLQFSSLI